MIAVPRVEPGAIVQAKILQQTAVVAGRSGSSMVKEGLLPEGWLRNARLGSGLLILFFLITHMINHMLGLISLEAAEQGRRLFLGMWRNPISTVLLYGSFVLHIALVLRAVYLRRSFVMPRSEAVQILLGLAIPLLLMEHVIGTRIASEIYDFRDSYFVVVKGLWKDSPFYGLQQVVALVVVWLHGCIGVHFWLRNRLWYVAIFPWLLTVAILLPVLVLLGYTEMGRTLVEDLALGRGYPGGYHAPPPASARHEMHLVRSALYGSFAFSLVLVAALRIGRRFRERAHLVAIRYPNGQVIRVPRGYSVLEASRLAGQPHYAVCGGKGQCSTCRVQVVAGREELPLAESFEQRTLSRIGAGPGVRLACQLRPRADVTVAPLLVPLPDTALPVNAQEAVPGREHEIAVMFCDIRHFTMLTETRLPFDIVFLLNRYFSVVGHAVSAAGGRIDKFIGDGAMALFGVDTNAEEGSRQAMRAAELILAGIDELNAELADEYPAPLRVAIGIHAGPAVIGTLGYGNVSSMTAIGDTVNVASRLEAVAKEYGSTLAVSEPVALLSGIDIGSIASYDITIRGRLLPLKIYFPQRPDLAISA